MTSGQGGSSSNNVGSSVEGVKNAALQNLLNGDSADKSVKKQRVWKKDMLRQDDFTKMREMVTRLRKHRVNEAAVKNSGMTAGGDGGTNISGVAGGPGKSGKSLPARTSIQQTQGSNNLIKKEAGGVNRRSYLNK